MTEQTETPPQEDAPELSPDALAIPPHAQSVPIRSTSLIIPPELDVMTLGELLAKSGFFSDTRDAAQAVVKVLAGRELGFGPIASMTGINIIKGKVAMSANLIAASVKRGGKYNYRVDVLSDTACRIVFLENGREVGVSEFTMDDAKQAQLVNNQTWQKFPRNMLFARAISNGAKWYCADVFGGPIYTPDELGAQVDEEGDIIDMAPRTTPTLSWVSDPEMDDEAAATQAADTRRPPDRQRGRSNTGASQKPTPRPPANNGDDQPWQEYIANWTQKDWGRYWQDMKETVGLTEDEVHEAIGNPLGEDGKPSVKAFTGTRGEKRALIRAAVEAKKTEQGAFTATRVYAKSVIGGKPLVKMYALDKRTRREDPLPMIVDEPVETATLREWFPATPKPLSVDEDGSLIYQHDPDSGVSVTVVYQQQGGHKTVKSVRFYEAPNTASE